MREGIASRVGRIVSGSFNALVEVMEDMAPESVMEEAIREVDDAMREVRSELGRELAGKHLASKKLAQENSKHEELSEKIELALQENRDDLAEAAVSRQLDIEAQIPILEQQIAECSAKEKELEGYILALQAKKREMREELDNFRESKREVQITATQSGSKASNGSNLEQKVDQATSSFERVLSRQISSNFQAGMTQGDETAKLAELEEISRKNRIQERILAKKRALEQGN